METFAFTDIPLLKTVTLASGRDRVLARLLDSFFLIIPLVNLVIFCVDLVFLFQSGQTIGKKIMGIQLQDPLHRENQGLIYFLRTLCQWLAEATLVIMVIDLYLMSQPQKTTLMDMVFKTRVVKAS